MFRNKVSIRTLCCATLFMAALAAGPARAAVLNSFEALPGDILPWNMNSSPSITISTPDNGSVFQAQDGSNYAYLTYSATDLYDLTLPSTWFAGGNDLHNNSVLSLKYATKDMIAAFMYLDLRAGSFQFLTPNLQPVGTPAKTSADWRTFSVSLNYLSNIGIPLANFPAFAIYHDASHLPYPPFDVQKVHVAYDALEVDNPGNTMTPNGAPTGVSVASTCQYITLTLPLLSTTPVAGATNPPAGYHIYRSTQSATSGFASYAYTSRTASSWQDTGTTPSITSYWYKVIIYDTIPAGVNNTLLNCNNDPAISQMINVWGANAGVHECLLSVATAVPATLQPATLPLPTPGPVTATGCNNPAPGKVQVSWVAPAAMPPGSCNSIAKYRVFACPRSTFNISEFGTLSDVRSFDSSGPVNGADDIGAAAGTIYYYRVIAIDDLGNQSVQSTYSTSGQIQPGVCGTIIATATVTPASPTPVAGEKKAAYLYPNPFSPDKGQKFRIKFDDPATAASKTVTIYNMVGEKVIDGPGDYFNTNGWDGFNSNGVKVVTGVYFLVISGETNVYKVAVLR